MNDSVAASAGPVPPIAKLGEGLSTPAEPLPIIRITPEPWAVHHAARRPRGDEVRPRAGLDRAHEVLDVHVQQRRALHVAARDEVDRHVQAALPGDLRDVSLDRGLVEHVEHRDLGPAGARGGRLEARAVAPGEVHRGALAGERARHDGADPAAAVDDRPPPGEQTVGAHAATSTRACSAGTSSGAFIGAGRSSVAPMTAAASAKIAPITNARW